MDPTTTLVGDLDLAFFTLRKASQSRLIAAHEGVFSLCGLWTQRAELSGLQIIITHYP